MNEAPIKATFPTESLRAILEALTETATREEILDAIAAINNRNDD